MDLTETTMTLTEVTLTRLREKVARTQHADPHWALWRLERAVAEGARVELIWFEDDFRQPSTYRLVRGGQRTDCEICRGFGRLPVTVVPRGFGRSSYYLAVPAHLTEADLIGKSFEDICGLGCFEAYGR